MKYLILLFVALSALGQGMNINSGGEILSETPFYNMPEGMTFEEYRDAVRYKYGLLGRDASITPQVSPDGGVGFGISIE